MTRYIVRKLAAAIAFRRRNATAFASVQAKIAALPFSRRQSVGYRRTVYERTDGDTDTNLSDDDWMSATRDGHPVAAAADTMNARSAMISVGLQPPSGGRTATPAYNPKHSGE